MKLAAFTLTTIIFCCTSYISTAQTFSTTINGPINYSSDFVPARNSDYFIASTIKVNGSYVYDIYCARIDKTGAAVWEKIFKTAYSYPEVRLLGTSDNGLLVFIKDRVDSANLNYGLLIKCNHDGNIDWSKRFQVKDNQFIHPADMIETSRAEYVLLYDTRLDDLFANNKPQVAVFNKTGNLVSQTGLGDLSFLSRGDNYYSRALLLNDKGEYFIAGKHSYVDLENSTNMNLIKINKNGTASLREVSVNDSYDSGWPIELSEKNGNITILGGYSKYTGSSYKNFYSFTAFNDSATVTNTMFADYDPFVLQNFAYNKIIKFPSYGNTYVLNDGSMLISAYTGSGYNINKYDVSGRICPDYTTPIIDLGITPKHFDISKLRITKKIDTIFGLADYVVSVRDTVLFTVNCSGSAVAASAMLPEAAIAKNNGLKLYPNPATNFIMVDFTLANTASVAIQLTSSHGSILQAYTETFTTGGHQYKINTASLAPGMYFIKLLINSKQQVLKFIKE